MGPSLFPIACSGIEALRLKEILMTQMRISLKLFHNTQTMMSKNFLYSNPTYMPPVPAMEVHMA